MAKTKAGTRASKDEPSTSSSSLPSHLELQRTRIVCGPNINSYTNSSLAEMQFMPSGEATVFDMEQFKKGFDIEIVRYDDMEMIFHMKGISCGLANALRRIIIAEVPTIAIEHVFMVNNTGVIHDEMLSHRLGLVPLAVDPRLFQYKLSEDPASETNTIVLRLRVACRRLKDGSMENDKVYSGQLEWLPEGSEMPEETGCNFAESQEGVIPPARPVHDDILLAKLRPGQEIELEAHCIKGVGEDHAKWSPVATAWYKFMPEVVLLRSVKGSEAKELAEELPGLITLDKSGKAVVGEALAHEKLLEKVRRLSGEPKWEGVIQLRKIKNHFVFTIQSTGAWKPHELFQYAIKLLKSKCDKVLEGLQRYPRSGDDMDAE